MERIVFLINEEFSGVSTYFCAIQFPNDFPGSNDPPARPSTLRAVLHPRGLPDPHGDRPGPRRPCPTCTGRGTEWPASRPGTRHTRWGWRVRGWWWWLTVQSDPTAINKLKAALSTSLATAQETGKKRRLEIWFSFWRSLRVYCEDIIFQWTNFLQQNKEQRQWSKMKKRWVIPTFVLDVSRVFDGFYAMM